MKRQREKSRLFGTRDLPFLLSSFPPFLRLRSWYSPLRIFSASMFDSALLAQKRNPLPRQGDEDRVTRNR